MKVKVVFFPVKTVKQKLEKIPLVARYHFFKKEHFILFVPDEKAALFISDLLWKSPPSSFLPHFIQNQETNDWVVISSIKKNFNRARFAFNLSPLPLLDEYHTIYELEDRTDPGKLMLSQTRFEAYKKRGYTIETR